MTAVTEGTGRPDYKKAAAARRADRADMPGSKAAAELATSGALDGLFAKIDSGEIELTGDGGLIPWLIKRTGGHRIYEVVAARASESQPAGSRASKVAAATTA